MPFPLAHPAAILPLRRFCPRHLSLIALLIGSVVPDIAYVVDDLGSFRHFVSALGLSSYSTWLRDTGEWSDLSHTLWGSLVFDLPAGIVIAAVWFALAGNIVLLLPQPYRNGLKSLSLAPRPTVAAIAISLAVGIGSHLAWDSFTHSSSWLAQHWTFLRAQTVHFMGRRPTNASFLWLISSTVGLLACLAAYGAFLRAHRLSLIAFERGQGRCYAFWIVVFLLPAIAAIPITRHFMRVEFASPNDYSYIVHVFSEYYLAIVALSVATLGVFGRQIRPVISPARQE